MRQFVTWLGFPLALIVLVLAGKVIFAPDSKESEIEAVRGLGGDKKLRRTIEHFDSAASDAGSARVIPIGGPPGIRIDIALDDVQLAHLARTRDWTDKLHAKKFYVPIRIGGGDERAARIKVHGDSTLKKPRKSLRVELFDTKLRAGDAELETFFLLGLQNDPESFRMLFCNTMLAELGLFPSFQAPVTLYLNGEPQGIYLLVERPVDAIVRTHPDAVSVYRRYGRSSVQLKFARPVPDAEMTMIRLKRAYEDLEGEAARAAYLKWLNVDQYCAWLAFNSLVRNADSADEVFFYEVRAPKGPERRMNIMGWDYDDIMRPASGRRKTVKDPLFHAAEADLDKAVRKDDVLYARFKETFRTLLDDAWTEEKLNAALDEVKQTLDVIDLGFDSEKTAKILAKRAEAMEEFSARLIQRRRELVGLLESPAQ